jgi:hypothetical protein
VVNGPKHDVLMGYLHGNDTAATFQKSLFDLFGYDMAHEGRIRHWVSVRAPIMGIPDARNSLCQQVLKSDAQWLFMLDADMGFEPILLDLLLSVADPKERPIVGGLAFSQREAVPDGRNGFRTYPTPTIFDWRPHPQKDDGSYRFIGRLHYPVNTLIQAGATGGAVLVIHRSVLERIQTRDGDQWFTRIPDAGGEMQGEDISFFDRCRQLEIPLHIHTGIRTTHFKHRWLAEEDYWQSFFAPPATEEVDVIVPVLHRPQNVKPLMESLRASTGLARAWFVTEPDDDEEAEEVRSRGGRLIPHAGTFSEKVNHAFRYLATPPIEAAPWVLLVGDDVRFRPGWLDHAQDIARRYNAMVVGTNDLANARVMRGEHATHPMISRAYVDELGSSWDGPGVVCHEGYRHWYVDDEICKVAVQRGVFQAALASEVEHLHPMVGKSEMDEVYQLGQAHTVEDGKLFQSRLARFAGGPNRDQRRHPEKRPQLVLAR